jgi:hypothetical protein
MKEQQSERRSLFGRKMPRRFERTAGKKRLHKSLAEKFRKYEVRAEGYEFLPAMMHLVGRYLADLPAASQNEMDKSLAAALDTIPGAKNFLGIAAKNHAGLPRELKRRVFSPAYLNLKVEQGIDTPEVASIVQRANRLRNLNVRAVGDVLAPPDRTPTKDGHKGCCCCCQAPPNNQPDPRPTTPPNQYELTFTKLYCVDESDPEFFGSDEPYVVFGIITEEMAEAGTAAVAVHSPVYEDVDDGDTRPSSGDQNLRLFGFTGPRAIDSSVLITASCFENDLGDVSDTTDAVRSALTTAATTAAGAGGVAGWIVAGAAAIAIGVTYLIDLFGADDQISDAIPLSLTEAQADATTAAVNPAIFPPLHFDGGDDDGIYDVYLKLRRV